MKSFSQFLSFAVLTSVLSLAGCGSSMPNADVPEEKLAPPATDLGSDPEYAKQFSKKK